MVQIEKIIPRKRGNFVELTLSSGEIYQILNSTILNFNIFPGRELSFSEFSSIIKHDEFKQAEDQAVKYLARRIHSSNEIYTKLIKKKFKKEVINSVISSLKEKRYLNDEEFLNMFIQDRLNFSKKGRNIIIKELIQKGFRKEQIEDVLNSFIDPEEELKKAIQIAQKKWNLLKEKKLNDAIQKLKYHLIQKGYTPKTTDKAIQMVISDN